MKEKLEALFDETVKFLTDNAEALSNRIDIEKNKIDIKSQIGHHERVIRKNYARLGEAYYDYMENYGSMEKTEDLLESIKTNKKVIELLNAQLAELEKKTTVEKEEKEEVVAEEVVEEPTEETTETEE